MTNEDANLQRQIDAFVSIWNPHIMGFWKLDICKGIFDLGISGCARKWAFGRLNQRRCSLHQQKTWVCTTGQVVSNVFWGRGSHYKKWVFVSLSIFILLDFGIFRWFDASIMKRSLGRKHLFLVFLSLKFWGLISISVSPTCIRNMFRGVLRHSKETSNTNLVDLYERSIRVQSVARFSVEVAFFFCFLIFVTSDDIEHW